LSFAKTAALAATASSNSFSFPLRTDDAISRYGFRATWKPESKKRLRFGICPCSRRAVT
jgi:hypothetical protein